MSHLKLSKYKTGEHTLTPKTAATYSLRDRNSSTSDSRLFNV